MHPAFIEQHITGFFGRGMLAAEAVNTATEQAITANTLAGATVIPVTLGSSFSVGSNITVKHDNGIYGSYFISSISNNNIGIRPSLRYACTAAKSRVERTWFNRAHPGKFYMRQLAQRIASSTELDAAMPNGARVLYTDFSSATAIEDTLTPLGGAVINYYAASNLGETAAVNSPVRFGTGRTAYVDSITAAGAGIETQYFDVQNVASAVLKIVFLSSGMASTVAVKVIDEAGAVRSKYTLPAGVDSSVQRIYTYPADLRGAKRIKVQIVSDGASSGYFTVGHIDVFEAPKEFGKIIANPSAKIVVLGDSWVAGDLASTPEREPITKQLAIELPCATIVNKGVGGNKITDMIARFDADVTPNSPDYVVVNTGTNESYNPLSSVFSPNALMEFINQYRILLNKIHAINARAIVVGVPALSQSDVDVPSFAEWQLNDRAKAYARRVFESQGGKPSVMSGSNANGDWTKFSDGTLICRHTVSVTTSAINVPCSVLWTYPVPFLLGTVPKIQTSVSGYGTGQVVGVGANGATASATSVVLASSLGATSLPIDCVAIGRWF